MRTDCSMDGTDDWIWLDRRERRACAKAAPKAAVPVGRGRAGAVAAITAGRRGLAALVTRGRTWIVRWQLGPTAGSSDWLEREERSPWRD